MRSDGKYAALGNRADCSIKLTGLICSIRVTGLTAVARVKDGGLSLPDIRLKDSSLHSGIKLKYY